MSLPVWLPGPIFLLGNVPTGGGVSSWVLTSSGGHCGSRYASYWNAFLFEHVFKELEASSYSKSGKPGKWEGIFQSGIFEQTGKSGEINTKYCKCPGISDKYYLLFLVASAYYLNELCIICYNRSNFQLRKQTIKNILEKSGNSVSPEKVGTRFIWYRIRITLWMHEVSVKIDFGQCEWAVNCIRYAVIQILCYLPAHIA